MVCTMVRRLILYGLALLLGLAGLSPATALAETGGSVPTFSLSISNANPAVNDSFEVEVKGSGLADLYGYEMNLTYDATRLRFVRASSGMAGFSIEPIVKGNTIQFAHTQTGRTPGRNGSVALATLTFKAIAAGTVRIALSNLKLVDSAIQSAVITSSASVTATVKSGRDEKPGDHEATRFDLSDIAGHWAKTSIETAVGAGFIAGYTDGSFRPDAVTTRSEFAVMLSRALKLEEEGELSFADLGQIPAWARPFVARAMAAGILSGYEDATFRPGRSVTRAEMTVMIVRALALKTDPDAKLPFADADSIPAWAAPSVAAAYEAGLVQGRGRNLFAPNELATRAEAVIMILGLLKLTETR